MQERNRDIEKAIRGAKPSESNYQRKLLKKLKSIPNSKFFVKEAKSIRALPDIVGCISGKMVMLEVKKSQKEYDKWDDRQHLQNHVLNEYRSIGAYCSFIYPENESEVLSDLLSLI